MHTRMRESDDAEAGKRSFSRPEDVAVSQVALRMWVRKRVELGGEGHCSLP